MVKPKKLEDVKIEPEDRLPRSRFKLKLNYLIDMGMAVTFLTTFVTGIIKFPELLTTFGFNQRELPMYELSILHDYGALFMGLFILAHLVLHFKWLTSMTVKNIRLMKANRSKVITNLGVLFIIFIFIFLLLQTPAIQNLIFYQKDTINIEGIGDFKYEPAKIQTIRPDIFNAGHFSLFDILVYLNNRSKIDMEYHFDSTMNTYVIDNINGRTNWWYEAYYDGGWPENNVFRMDHYPYKDKMTIKVSREDSSYINRVYGTFRDEVTRLEQNSGRVIIPRVIIQGTKNTLTFENVVVQPHNLRNDMFKEGVITAIDVIMTLGDDDLISYKLNWYSSIGTAEVKTYYVDKINSDSSRGRCGFVYEAGSNQFKRFSGNHIHIPADIRVINSPEYEEWFWICI
jgi:hypothetical protein